MAEMFTIPENLVDLVALNDAYRRPDAVGDIWPLGTFAGCRQTEVRAPLLRPMRQDKAKSLPDQKVYNNEFESKFPQAAAVLPCPNIIVAGGAAAWPLGPSSASVSDVDFFVVGSLDAAARWAAVYRLVLRLKNQLPADANVHESLLLSLRPGLLTVQVWPHSHDSFSLAPPWPKMQIMLRAYPSVSALLHAFDVPAACVAFDGRVTVATALGAHAHLTRTNLVWPAYRSTTYEVRLVKYFVDKGFGLAFPHLRRDALAAPGVVRLEHLELEVLETAGRGPAKGMVRLPGDLVAPPTSDYTPDNENSTGIVDDNEERTVPGLRDDLRMRANVYQLTRSQRFLATPSVEDLLFPNATPRLPDCLTRARLVRYLQQSLSHVLLDVRGRATLRGRIDVTCLSFVYGLSPAQVGQFAAAVAAVPGRGRIDPSAALEPFIERALRAYDTHPGDIAWWIVDEPGRQWTAACNPRMEDPIEWYGLAEIAVDLSAPVAFSADDLAAFSADDLAAVSADDLAATEAASVATKPLAESCALCLLLLMRGTPNTTILACGHVFHAAVNAECGGLFTWMRSNNSTCPLCRTEFGEAPRGGPELQAAPAPVPLLRVAWEGLDPPALPAVWPRAASEDASTEDASSEDAASEDASERHQIMGETAEFAFDDAEPAFDDTESAFEVAEPA